MKASEFDWILYRLRQGCIIYRESQPKIIFQMFAGKVLRHDPQIPDLEARGLFLFQDLLAEDWHWRCPGHDWQYHPDDPNIRQCRICEHDEVNGAWANARDVWLKAREDEWRKTAKALPAAGVTTHPEPVTCCENYPRCNCEEMNRLYHERSITEELAQRTVESLTFHISMASHHAACAKRYASSLLQGKS